MRIALKTTVCGILAALFLGTTSHGQHAFQSSWILAEEGRAQQMFFGARSLLGVDVKFSNLGEMPYLRNSSTSATYLFNDGYIDIPSPGAEFTSNFSFDFANATKGADGTVESFNLTRYRSKGIGESFEKDLDFSTGWELGARYDMWKLSNRVTTGFTVAAAFTPLRASYASTEIKGELYRQRVSVPLSGPGIDYVSSGQYVGNRFGGPFILTGDLNFDESFEERVSQTLADGSVILVDALISGTYEMLGGIGTFRAGSHLDIYLTDRLLLHFGIGLLASYLSYDFKVDQSLITSTLTSSYRVSNSKSEGEWLAGAYAELNLLYRLNPRTSIYAGGQANVMQKFDSRTVDDTVLDIRIGSSTQLQAGFEFEF
jgi:hypothetical protein